MLFLIFRLLVPSGLKAVLCGEETSNFKTDVRLKNLLNPRAFAFATYVASAGSLLSARH